MSITSFYFWPFLLAALVVYYLTPSAKQWVLLLLASLAFSVLVCGWAALAYLLLGVMPAYLGARCVSSLESPRARKAVLAATLVLIIGELAALKYTTLISNIVGIFSGLLGTETGFSPWRLAVPLGVSYYTLSLIGYVLDVYWGKYPPQTNFLKQLLFACYFPQLTSGPITRYDQMAGELYGGHEFDPKRILFGVQRMLWGLFKKLVIADRAAIFVTAIYSDFYSCNGFVIAAAVVMFALQLYADFSGCMDIILGVSECFGIRLPENFDTPFFSETVAEFWRRWHITMGVWFKDYLLYPVLKSAKMQRYGARLKKRFGKKASKDIVTYTGLVLIWLIIGVWHGGDYKYIFASGVLPGFFLVSGQLLQPVFEKTNKLLKINTETTSWHCFRMLRTFACMCASWLFIRAPGLADGFRIIGQLFSSFNIWTLFDDRLLTFGLTWKDFSVINLGVAAIWIAGLLHRRGVHIRESVFRQNIAVQYLITLAAIFAIIILGIYGPAYSASDFIYKNF